MFQVSRKLFAQIVCLASLGVTAGVAQAQTAAVPPPTKAVVRLATPVVPKVALSTKSIVETGSVLSAGQAVLTYDATPKSGVVIGENSIIRRDAFPNSLPAQTFLFEADISGDTAFCSPLVANQGVRSSQCFVDLNSDGKFDAGYVTKDVSKGQKLYWGQLWRLAPISQLTYTTAAEVPIQSEPMTFYFRRLKDGKAEFQRSFGLISNDLPPIKCEIDGTTACKLGDHEFTFEAVGAQVKVKAIEVKPPSST